VDPVELKRLTAEEEVVFLAGPVAGASRWRHDLRRIMGSLSAVPLRILDPRDVPDLDPQQQAAQEWGLMHKAASRGVLVFWLATQEDSLAESRGFPKPFGQITRLELGYFLGLLSFQQHLRLALGIPNFEYTVQKISRVRPELNLAYDLPTLAQTAIEILSKYRS
jgi:hypothetical protein